MRSFYEIGLESGTDKVTHHRYDRFYPLFLDNLRGEEFSMLEIGIDQKKSLDLWKEYFPLSAIYGMDIGFEYRDDRCQVFKGDQSSKSDLSSLKEKIGTCRLIIDDGSHAPYHQFDTFSYLFENLLEKGGIYIIEDIECNYWSPNSSVYGYNIGHFNLMELLKSYPDMINSEFSRKRNDLQISSVFFGKNCVILKKMTSDEIEENKREYRFSGNL